jgi:DNA primase
MEPGKIHEYDFWLSLGGLSSISLDHLVSKWRRIKSIVFCLDCDTAADEAYARIGGRYVYCGYSVSRHTPEKKDWNVQLLHCGYSFPAPHIPWGVAQ